MFCSQEAGIDANWKRNTSATINQRQLIRTGLQVKKIMYKSYLNRTKVLKNFIGETNLAAMSMSLKTVKCTRYFCSLF